MKDPSFTESSMYVTEQACERPIFLAVAMLYQFLTVVKVACLYHMEK